MENNFVKEIILSQFNASIEMLKNAITFPDKLRNDRRNKPEFCYLVYHTLFWFDFYLIESPDDFVPPKLIVLAEFDPEGVLPERVYTKEELLKYVEHGRNKCIKVVESLNDVKVNKHYKYGSVEMSFGELLLYNYRHVQHGVG